MVTLLFGTFSLPIDRKNAIKKINEKSTKLTVVNVF